MTNEFKIISEDGLKTLCKAIKKVSTVGEVIDDDNSVTDKTYSSFKIDRRLNTKIDKTQLTTVLDENVTDEQIPGAKVVVDELGLKANDSEVVKKTDIATTINSASTDNEVPSAKAVYNTTSKFLKTYTSIEQLGLISGSETIENIVNSMEGHTRLITVIELPNKYIYPGNCGTLIVEKLNIYRVHFKFCADGVSTVFVGTYHAVSGFTGWHRLCTTKVADVKGSGTRMEQTGYTVTNLNYTIINGVCYIPQIQITCNTPVAVSNVIGMGLPIPNIQTDRIYTTLSCWGDTTGSVALMGCGVDKSGKFVVAGGTAGKSYVGGISYPVAE